jgi:hypothetical protein
LAPALLNDLLKPEDEECAMKSLICSAFVAASLALVGNAAMAADSQVHTNTKAPIAHAPAAVHVAARGRYPAAGPNFDATQVLQSIYGGGPVAGPAVASWGYSSTHSPSTYSPSYDSQTVETSSSNAGQDATAEANDTEWENSMQAAQEQNDESNAAFAAGMAAAEQTEINANQ